MPEKKTRKQIAKEKEKLAVITDGCNPELVSGADFDGAFEIPVIKKPSKIMVPKGMVPFSKMDRVEPEKFAVCEYEMDREFADLLRYTDKYIPEIRKYQAFVSPDASLYWDMPFAAQVVNKYRSNAIGYYFQKKGIYVIPNVRWGDERTYTTKVFPEKLAFLGVEKHSIVSIGSYGIVKKKEEKKHFKAGLEAMLETLEPETVLVYGSMPEEVFQEYLNYTEFVKYPDWTTYIRSEVDG
ncbi:MAG: DUF4417 domain-containing protein [Lachnospiraceae bacterium]|nr:DUF4417 domain-containing protein [Lachnospiraceae bacterium]